MTPKQSRPIGITILSSILIISSIGYFAGAAYWIILSIINPPPYLLCAGLCLTPGMTAIILIVPGSLELVIGYGLLKGNGGGRKAAIVLAVIGLVPGVLFFGNPSTYALSFLFSNPYYLLALFVIYFPGSVWYAPGPIADSLVLVYLWTPKVRAYFRSGKLASVAS